MQKDIGIGFVGAGGNTKLRHLPGLAVVEGVHLVTVANRSASSSRAVAEKFGVKRVASDWRQVVDDPEVDAICIGTWPYLHAEVTLAALEAGKHVLTEARMAATLAEAQQMLAMSLKRPDLVAQVVPSPFTLDIDATVIKLLEDNRLGNIREIHVAHSNASNLDPEAPMNWRQDVRYSGINKLSMGIYHEVIQRWFPKARFTVNSAIAQTFTPRRRHWETGEMMAVPIPDSLHIHGSMDGTAVLNYHFSSIEPGPGRNEIRIVGSQATLRVEVASQAVFISDIGGVERQLEIPAETRRGWRVEEDFIASIRTGSPVKLTSFADGVRYMEFTDMVDCRLTDVG